VLVIILLRIFVFQSKKIKIKAWKTITFLLFCMGVKNYHYKGRK